MSAQDDKAAAKARILETAMLLHDAYQRGDSKADKAQLLDSVIADLHEPVAAYRDANRRTNS
jgi:hypothetical protein